MLANCLAAHSTKVHWLMSISKIWVVIKIQMKCFEIIVDPYFDYLVFKDGLQSVTCKWLCRLNSTEQNKVFIFLILIKTVYIRFLEWVIHVLYHQTTNTNAWGYEYPTILCLNSLLYSYAKMYWYYPPFVYSSQKWFHHVVCTLFLYSLKNNLQ